MKGNEDLGLIGIEEKEKEVEEEDQVEKEEI